MEIFWGVVGSLIGALLAIVVQEAIKVYRSKRGYLTGAWRQVITGTDGFPDRFDLVDLKSIGNSMTGTISRVQPKEQNFKKWKFVGELRGSFVFELRNIAGTLRNGTVCQPDARKGKNDEKKAHGSVFFSVYSASKQIGPCPFWNADSLG